MNGTRSSNRRALVIEFGVTRLNAGSASLPATIDNKKVAKIVTSFLTHLDTNLNNGLSYYSYNI